MARLTLSGMTATAAHIHPGAPGVNGPVLFPLTETVAMLTSDVDHVTARCNASAIAECLPADLAGLTKDGFVSLRDHLPPSV